MKNPAPIHTRGFTLIELLVAMAITTIMVSILISITSISLETWNRSRAELRAARQAQAMTEIMARDFEAMVVRSGNNFEWLSAISQPAVGPSASPSADLILFTAATDRYDGKIGTADDRGGDISTSAYSLRYNDPINAGGARFETFVLYRKLVNPDDTFGTNNRPSLLGQIDLQAAFQGQHGASLDQIANFVCENIYQFSVTFHLDTPNVQQRTLTIEQGRNTAFRVYGDRVTLNGAEMNPRPRITAVEISLTVISDTAMNALRRNARIPDDFISKNSFQYSKLIQVPHS